MPAPAPRLVLIDGSGYIFRAFYGLPPLNRNDGTPVGAVYGFSQMIYRLMTDMPDDDLAVIFDAGRRSFRNDLYDRYKANRAEPPEELVPQFPLVRDAARAFGLPVVELAGFEADDLIATYARLGREHGQEVLIVSSDKDLMQLISPGIAMYDPMKAKAIDDAEVADRFGVGPGLMGDLLALAGDASDNIPGVPGIGPKTAAQLLAQYGDLETLLARASEIKQPKRRQNLIEHAGDARLSRRLVTLLDTVEVPLAVERLKRAPIDRRTLRDFLRFNGFRQLLNRIGPEDEPSPVPAPGDAGPPAAQGFAPDASTAASSGDREGEELFDMPFEPIEGEAVRVFDPAPAAPPPAAFTTLAGREELVSLLAEATAKGVLSVDCETTSLNVVRAELVGLAFAVEPGRAFYLPLGHVDDFGHRRDGQMDVEEALDLVRPVLLDPSVLKIGHNLKYDMAVLARHAVRIAPYDDTLMLSYVLDGTSHPHNLDELALRHLGRETIRYDDVTGTGKKRIGFAEVAIDRATAYAAEDADVTLRLHRALKPRLVRERKVGLYEMVERPLGAIVAGMERAGIRVDTELLRSLSRDFSLRMAELEAKAHAQAGQPFNLGSPKQMGDVLFGSLGLPSGRKTPTGAYATGVDVLEELALQGHELPRTLLDWRQVQKLVRTYTEALVEEAVPQGNGGDPSYRVHTSFALAATSTGRLSSSEPNLQNIPIRTEEGRKIRRAFIAEKGHVLMSADYSQIELRILASMADIVALKEAFANDVDVHRVTASQMFGVPVEGLDPAMRRNAKTINYGIIYGIGAFGLAQRLGIPRDVARDYIANYFKQYPGIRDYMEKAKAEAREKGYVETLFGRRCFIAEIDAKNASRRAGAERAAINAPIQGTAADIMKRAMILVHDRLESTGSRARLLLQVHDELVFEVPEDDAAGTAALVKDVMESTVRLDVPLAVEVGQGGNWDEAH